MEVETTRPRRGLRLLLATMCAMLLLAFAAVGPLQARQVQLLNATQRFQDDALVWSLFQFEVEFMKLRLALEQAGGPSVAVDADGVEQRFEIFVSRLGLIETEHAAVLLQRDPDYLDVVGRARLRGLGRHPALECPHRARAPNPAARGQLAQGRPDP